MPCAGKSRSWWRRSWTSTACWSLGPCPGPSEAPASRGLGSHHRAPALPCPRTPGPAQGQALVRVSLALPSPTALLSSCLPPYALLCPLAPRKGSWLADKVKRLMRPRREGVPHGGPRLGADGAGSTDSLGGPPETELPEGREADGTGGSGGQVTRRSRPHVPPVAPASLPAAHLSPLAFPAARPTCPDASSHSAGAVGFLLLAPPSCPPPSPTRPRTCSGRAFRERSFLLDSRGGHRGPG